MRKFYFENKDRIQQIQSDWGIGTDQTPLNFMLRRHNIDIELLKQIRALVKIPIIIHGGCNGPKNIVDASESIKFEGVAVASLFHYHLVKKFKTYEKNNLSAINKNLLEGNFEYLLRN